MQKKFNWIGLSAPLVYIFAVSLGGFLWPGYSHVRQPISELSMASAPNLPLMDALFLTYNLLLLVFSLALFQMGRKGGQKNLAISGILLALCGITGASMLLFRQDPIGAPLTVSGTLHLVLAGISSLATILAIFYAAVGFGQNRAYAHLKPFSIIMGIVVLITGGLTAAGTTLLPHIFGILERLTIGAFMLWLVVVNWHMLRRENN